MQKFIKIFEKENRIVLFLFICAVVIYLITSLPMGYIFGTDEAVTVMPSKVLEKNGDFQYIDDFNIKYNTYWFGLPGYSVNSNRELNPRGFIGMRLLFTPLYFFISDEAINIFNSLLLAVSVIFMYLLTKLIFQDEFTAIAVSLIYMFSPFIWILSVYIFPEAAVLTFSLASIYYLFRSNSGRNKRYVIISGLFLSVTILIKIFYIILLIPFLLYLKKKNTNKKGLILYSLLVLLFISPQFIYNFQTQYNFFGFDYFIKPFDPYQTSYVPYGLMEKPSFIAAASYLTNEFLIPKDGGNFYLFHLKTLPTLFLKLSPLLILLPVGILWSYKKNKRVTIFIALTYSIFFLIFGNMSFYYGMYELNIRSSYIRYQILPLALLLILSGGLFSFLSERKLQKTRLFVVITIVLILVPISMSDNDRQNYFYVSGSSFKNDWLKIENSILSQTEDNSIILSTINELPIAMHRRLFYFANIPTNNDTEIKWVITSLLKDNIPVYVYRPISHPEYYMITVRGNPDYDFSLIENISVKKLALPNKRYELLKLQLAD